MKKKEKKIDIINHIKKFCAFFQNYMADKYGYEYHESQLRLIDKIMEE